MPLLLELRAARGQKGLSKWDEGWWKYRGSLHQDHKAGRKQQEGGAVSSPEEENFQKA